MTPAIRVENLSKAYRIGARPGGGYRTLREAIMEGAAAAGRRLRAPGRCPPAPDGGRRGEETLWALRDVCFEVQPGEVVAIIGRNGAGKSTLLKILGRITEPTAGRAELRGRLGSLLEVGTGFHPELSGRENIYLSGAILGMSRREIARQFDAIVAFAEVDRFLDTPVKRYSSGMYVRLAFAVAAHLLTEILIVDEVLAVGDVEFQRKCLGRMGALSRGGRTVLFVSHNMAAVQNLCTRAVLLARGRAERVGPCAEVVAAYMQSARGPAGAAADLAAARQPGCRPVIRAVAVRDAAGCPTVGVACGAPLTVEIGYELPGPVREPRFGIFFSTADGQRLFALNTRFQGPEVLELPPRGVVRCRIPALPLLPGSYTLSFGCSTAQEQLDFVEAPLSLAVEAADYFGTGRLPMPEFGRFLVPALWELPGDAAPAEETDPHGD